MPVLLRTGMQLTLRCGLVGAAFVAHSAVARAEGAQPNAPVAPPAVRVYLRSNGEPLIFSARAKAGNGAPSWCVAPCNAQLAAGDYQLKVNGVVADGSLELRQPGTVEGHYQSRQASRSGAWLALNVGGIIGGVFVTTAALGGPTWAYVAGGGSLAAGGVIFLLSYRADSASFSFTPGEPSDVRGMPLADPGTAARAALGAPELARFGSQARGLGFRVVF